MCTNLCFLFLLFLLLKVIEVSDDEDDDDLKVIHLGDENAEVWRKREEKGTTEKRGLPTVFLP